MKPKLDPGNILLTLAAIVQGVQYASAFGLVHSLIDGWAILGGVGAGLVVVLAMAYAGSRIPRIRSKKASKLAEWFFYTMLVVSPLILTPVNWYSMDVGLKTAIGWYAWVLAAMIATMPELALVLVSFAVDGGLIRASVSHDAKPAAHDATQKTENAKKKPAPVRICPKCGKDIHGNAGAHARWHCGKDE